MKLFSTKRRKVAVVSVSVALIAGLSGLAAAFFTSSGSGAGNAPVGSSSNVVIHQVGDTIYDSTLAPLPDNVPSIGYEATGLYELGDEITPVASTGPLSTVVVDMSSWACQTGSWDHISRCNIPGDDHVQSVQSEQLGNSGVHRHADVQHSLPSYVQLLDRRHRVEGPSYGYLLPRSRDSDHFQLLLSEHHSVGSSCLRYRVLHVGLRSQCDTWPERVPADQCTERGFGH
jgi:hypothetical protein